MSKEIIGVFTFRNEGDGCLTSKYLEHTENTPYTECCKKIEDATRIKSDDPFEGTYRTTWLQSNDGDNTAELNITRKGDVYDVDWTFLTKNGELEYGGRAMLYEGKLVGSYWNI